MFDKSLPKMLIEAVNTTAVAVAIPVCLLLFLVLGRLMVAYQVAKSPGIRAASIGDNPFSGTWLSHSNLKKRAENTGLEDTKVLMPC